MLPVDSVVELLELEQILVSRAVRAHPIVLAHVSEKHHGGSFIACSDACSLVLLASEFGEPGVALVSRVNGSDGATASLPFPFPTYATDVLLGGI